MQSNLTKTAILVNLLGCRTHKDAQRGPNHLIGLLTVTREGLIFILLLIFYYMGTVSQKIKFDPQATSISLVTRLKILIFSKFFIKIKGGGLFLLITPIL